MVNNIVQHSPDDFGCFLVDFGPVGGKKEVGGRITRKRSLRRGRGHGSRDNAMRSTVKCATLGWASRGCGLQVQVENSYLLSPSFLSMDVYAHAHCEREGGGRQGRARRRLETTPRTIPVVRR